MSHPRTCYGTSYTFRRWEQSTMEDHGKFHWTQWAWLGTTGWAQALPPLALIFSFLKTSTLFTHHFEAKGKPEKYALSLKNCAHYASGFLYCDSFQGFQVTLILGNNYDIVHEHSEWIWHDPKAWFSSKVTELNYWFSMNKAFRQTKKLMSGILSKTTLTNVSTHELK